MKTIDSIPVSNGQGKELFTHTHVLNKTENIHVNKNVLGQNPQNSDTSSTIKVNLKLYLTS